MNKKLINIIIMMKELLSNGIEIHNQYVVNKNDLLLGRNHAYKCVLSALYNQLIVRDIPLEYFGLDIIGEPEKIFFSNEMVNYTAGDAIPVIDNKNQSDIINWMEHMKEDVLNDIYELHIPESEEDEFNKFARIGFKEIFNIMEKYGIKII